MQKPITLCIYRFVSQKSTGNTISKSILFLLIVYLGSGITFAQDMTGVTTDRYTGVNRALLNPSYLSDSPFCFHLSLVTANLGLQNNYFYIPAGRFTIADLFDENADMYRDPGGYFSETQPYNNLKAFQYARVQGPSFLLRYNDHTFAFVNSLRTATFARNVPSHLMRFATEGLSYTPQHNIDYDQTPPFSAGTLSWAELGISYGTTFSNHPGHNYSFGAKASYIQAYHASIFNADELEYMVSDDRDISIYNFTSTAHSAIPMDYDENEFTGLEKLFRGKGVSFDLGISYTQKLKPPQRKSMKRLYTLPDYEPYVYRLGFSLLDVGFVHMNQNTKSLEFDQANTLWGQAQTTDLENIDEFVSNLQSQLHSGEIHLEDDKSFRVFLPTAASLQADYNLGNNFFAYGLWVQDLPLVANRISRPSYLGFIPRYETRWFTFALPVTLYEYTKPRIGASLRIGVLTIGAEQPGGVMHINDLEGFDFYFSINWGIKQCRS